MANAEQYHPSLNDPHAWVPYRYYPNLPAAIVFAILFGVVTLAHSIYMWKRRTWYFTPFIIGGCCTYFWDTSVRHGNDMS